MGAAADLLDVEPAFLRALGHQGLLNSHRSQGGHRRDSRADLALAARAHEIVDDGHTVAATCRIALIERKSRPPAPSSSETAPGVGGGRRVPRRTGEQNMIVLVALRNESS
ncbi:MerR family transcriptional regulator [Pseudofrankia inefficax]